MALYEISKLDLYGLIQVDVVILRLELGFLILLSEYVIVETGPGARHCRSAASRRRCWRRALQAPSEGSIYRDHILIFKTNILARKLRQKKSN